MDRVILGKAARSMAVLGPFTVAELLGRAITDERSLSLASAPAYVLTQDVPGGATRCALVLGQALGRRALMDLLYTLAPYKAHGPERFARVLDNWRLHDRAVTSAGSANLLLQHANSLKLSWQVFAQHRERFLAVFEDQTESTRLLPVITWEQSTGGVRSWHFDDLDQSFVEAIVAAVPVGDALDGPGRVHLDALAGLVTIPYFLPELRKDWQAWQPLVKNGKSNYVGPASVPVVALMHRRAMLNSGLIDAAEALVAATWTERS